MATSTQIEPHQDRAKGTDRGDRSPIRNELPTERLDRNSAELMAQLRVAGTGIQVLLAFLLVVPFNARWSQATAFDRYVYFVTLLCMAAAAVRTLPLTASHIPTKPAIPDVRAPRRNDNMMYSASTRALFTGSCAVTPRKYA